MEFVCREVVWDQESFISLLEEEIILTSFFNFVTSDDSSSTFLLVILISSVVAVGPLILLSNALFRLPTWSYIHN